MLRIAGILKGAVVLTTLALFIVPSAAETPQLKNLDGALQAVAPKILKELQDRKVENVGVLKFLVADSNGVLRDNVGPINRTLADRLEVALTLALEDDKLGVIVGASDGVLASANARANHRTPSGRKALFTIGAKSETKFFTVPWKPNAKILPDAFLTGEATISKDRRTLAVKIQLFDKAMSDTLATIAEFTAANDLRTLTDSGLTYSTRGANLADINEAVALAGKPGPTADDKGDDLKKKAEDTLGLLKESPVKLEILYDGVAQEVTADAGTTYSTNALLRVAAPQKDTKVSFRLTNRGDDTYGAVLRVNGRNTLYEQRQDPLACYKWILGKGKSVTVSGFQSNESDAVPFKVLSPAQSEAESLNYGENAGTFDLILFRGVPEPESVLVKLDPELAAISRGAMVLQGDPAATDFKSFKAQLKGESDKETTRGRSGGMIVADTGATTKNPVKYEKFYASPLPVLSTTIRYYSLKN